MRFEIRKWRTAIEAFGNSVRICQHKCVLAVLREAISLGCIVLFCSSVVQAQAPAVPGTALANPNKTIRSSQGTSAADEKNGQKRSQNRRARSPEKIAANMDEFGYAAEPL